MGAVLMSNLPSSFTRVQVVVHLGFDDESDRALQVAWNVAQRLLDEGVWVDLIPNHVLFGDLLGGELAELPKIEINGWVAVIGRAPDPDELYSLITSTISSSQNNTVKRLEANAAI